MSIPISVVLFDRGANGAPTTNNPVNLAGRVESYDDALSDQYGFETARVSWTPTAHEIDDWARFDHLMRPMVAYSPDAREIWEGVLAEIEIGIGTKKIAFSIKDMANRLTVRYSEPGGKQGDSTTYSNAASQALFGIKDRVINASVAASAAASNQAQTILAQLAFPTSKHPSSAGTARGDLSISLTFWGKYALLDWLLTANTSTASTATSTQIASLLAAYAAVNPFFSTSAANIAATGVSDTEYIEPDTTYREKIERLLARGNSSQQPLTWGFYEGGVFTVAPRSTTVRYYESEASGQIRDQWQNVVDPWDVRPNAMAQVVDLLDAPTPGATETPLRKYVARVARSVRGSDVTVTLEPGDVESLESLLTSPAGGGPAGTSERQAAFERKVTAPARSVFAPTDNDTRYDRDTGVWKPAAGGTGIPNTGTIDTGGRDISYPPGAGTYTGITGSGTIGALAKWTATGELGNATAGTDYANASHNHAAGDITSGTMATGRLGSGTASSSTFLRGDSTWQAISTIPPATIGAAPDDAKYIVQTASSGLSAEQALGALATGLLKNTTSTGVLSIATAGTDYAAASHTHDASDVTSGTFNTARLGSGTASSTRFLRGDSTWQLLSTITPADVSAAPDDATYIVKTASSGLSAEFALSTLTTGLLKVTTTTGALTTATAADLPAHASRHANGGADEIAIDTSQITTGTMATARLGSGTANSTKYLAGDSTWTTFPDVITGTGAAPSGSNYSVAYWDGTASLAADSSGLIFNPTNNRLGIGANPTKTLEVNGNAIIGGGLVSASLASGLTASSGQVHASSTIISDDGFSTGTATWALGAYTASGAGANTGHLSVTVSGVTYKVMTKT